MSTAKKLVLTLALATSIVLLMAGVAFAAGDAIPHGGYSATTDACLQCHDVHEAGSDYVLLRWATVVDTCGSCHFLYLGEYPKDMSVVANQGSGGAGTYASGVAMPGQIPAYDPGYDGNNQVETATPPPASFSANNLGSRTSAYEVDYSEVNSHSGHLLQQGNGTYLHADGVTADGSYIPGGGSLTALDRAMGPAATIPTLDRTGTNGLYCASCHTPHGAFGQMMDTAFSTKILSSKPNHIENALTLTDWSNQGGQWCEACHAGREPEYEDIEGNVYHNHPDQFCLNCHGDAVPAGPGINSDFPHTGENDNLLTQEPDALCLDCHGYGTLP